MQPHDLRRRASVGSWFFVAAAVVVWVSGCGEGSCPETPCGIGEVCEGGECVAAGECPGGCGAGEICRDGTCVDGEDGQCESAGESCDVTTATGEGFLCVPWSGDRSNAQCARICSDGSTCAEGSACVLTQSLRDAPCSSSSDCSARKTCSEGRCRFAVCRPSECEGFLEGDATCQELYGDDDEQYPDGAKCYGVSNGAEFCLPAGSRERGEACTGVDQAAQQGEFAETCGIGLACESGTCVKACRSQDDCDADRECVGVESDVVREGVGQCAATCTPFVQDACGEGETCRPIDSETGRCVPAGDKSAFAACEPGAGECEEGLACIEHQQADSQLGLDRVARCHPICDTTLGDRNDEGELPDEEQDRRDATCPQPEGAEASYRVAHVAEGAGGVDVYRGAGASTAVAEGLAAGSSSEHDGGAYARVEPGSYDFSVLPEGAPATDVPVAEWTERMGAGEGRVFVLAAPGPEDDAEIRPVSLPAPGEPEAGSGEAPVRVVHTIPDLEAVDVVAVPPGESPGADGGERLLAEQLGVDAASDSSVIPAGSWDVFVFEAGTDRGEAEPLLTYEEFELTEFAAVHLRGTYATDDAYPTHPAVVLQAASNPGERADEPPMTCVEHQERAFGYCQQTCSGGARDYGSGICDGESMGCKPVLNQSTQAWEHRCGPVGEGEVGEPCNPFAGVGECAEGNYCLEYGNTRPGYQQGDPRGLCHSLCRVDDEEGAGGGRGLSCGSGEACQPISYTSDFGIGECGVACEPNDRYTDSSCPAGLKSCRPAASLQYDSSGQGNTPPVVETEQSFCSASGDVEPGRVCRAQNCRPESVCMYPRSEQQEFLNSLVSPFVGGSGQTPSCRRRCDPFDGDDSAVSCGSGETCLFNYPWSGEVGHCAAITRSLEPGEPCENPGLSCGEDSICAAQQGGDPVCMRFCEYRGPDVQGELPQSTCPDGYNCHPFARDIGRCESE